MATAQEAANKATVRRFDDAVVAPDVLFHMPLPNGATGA
jgi:hypothetical protein